MWKKKVRVPAVDMGRQGNLFYNGYGGYETLSSYYPKDPEWYLGLYNNWEKDRYTSTLADCPVVYNGAEEFEWYAGGQGHYNPCVHRKSCAVNHAYLTIIRAGRSPSDRVWTAMFYRLPTPAAIPYSLGTLQHPTIDYQAARARAWHNMQPRFEGKVSLLNFLFELKDFKDIAKYIFKYNNDLGHIRKALHRTMKRNDANLSPYKGQKRDHSFPDPTVPAAKGLLTYNLAIAPLVSDLGKIFQQANEIVREAQQLFNDAGETEQKSHYSEILEVVDNRSAPYVDGEYCRYGTFKSTKFTATMRYKYDYSMRPTIDAWMKYWGLAGSFSTFWNMIPFSFVVDYFVQIGNSIRAMEHDPNVDLHRVSYGESLYTEFNNGYSLSDHPYRLAHVINGVYYPPHLGNGTLLSGHKGSIFSRRACDPYYGPATPKIKWPSTKQALNMAALVRCLL